MFSKQSVFQLWQMSMDNKEWEGMNRGYLLLLAWTKFHKQTGERCSQAIVVNCWTTSPAPSPSPLHPPTFSCHCFFCLHLQKHCCNHLIFFISPLKAIPVWTLCWVSPVLAVFHTRGPSWQHLAGIPAFPCADNSLIIDLSAGDGSQLVKLAGVLALEVVAAALEGTGEGSGMVLASWRGGP